MKGFKLCMVVFSICLITGIAGAAPDVINYQGRVNSGGVPFHGAGEFFFVIVDQMLIPVWSSDGNYPPTTPIQIAVTNGLFEVALGGEPGMPPITPAVLSYDPMFLQVYFNDGNTGFQRLEPDQPLNSTAFSIRTSFAEYAELAANADMVDGKHADELRPRGTLKISYCIALEGVYPSHSKKPVSRESRAYEPFVGEIMLFAGNYPPVGWAFCDGQELLINDHLALYSLLGIEYGGDGSSTFALPDLRGRVPMGADLDSNPDELGETCGVPDCGD